MHPGRRSRDKLRQTPGAVVNLERIIHEEERVLATSECIGDIIGADRDGPASPSQFAIAHHNQVGAGRPSERAERASATRSRRAEHKRMLAGMQSQRCQREIAIADREAELGTSPRDRDGRLALCPTDLLAKHPNLVGLGSRDKVAGSICDRLLGRFRIAHHLERRPVAGSNRSPGREPLGR